MVGKKRIQNLRGHLADHLARSLKQLDFVPCLTSVLVGLLTHNPQALGEVSVSSTGTKGSFGVLWGGGVAC